jgi:hypothetical protein
MISHVLLMTLLAAPAPAAPSTANPTQARKALASCLNEAVKTDLDAKVEPAAFQAKLPTLCPNEKAAYRAASVAADIAGGIRRATAEQNAAMDLDDVAASTLDRYKDFSETNTKPR